MAASPLDELRQVGRMLWEAGLVSSHGGDMSLRLDDGSVLITMHGCMLGRIGDGGLVRDPQGQADGEPSLDTAIHRAIYAAQPQAREADQVAQALKTKPIVVARGLGSYAWGADLWQALQWTSVLEESARYCGYCAAWGLDGCGANR